MIQNKYCEDYWAPGGVELTLLAGTIARLNMQSYVLDIGCGSGCASINLALKFGCQCLAIDSEKEYVQLAQQNLITYSVTSLVSIQHSKIEELIDSQSTQPKLYDMIVAEGGLLSYVGQENLLRALYKMLKPLGIIAMSDLVFREGIPSGKFFLPFEIPQGICKFYQPGGYSKANGCRTTESKLDDIILQCEFEKVLSFELSHNHWQRYHSNMIKHGKAHTGPALRDPGFTQTIFHDECLWATDAQKYIAYYYSIIRKK